MNRKVTETLEDRERSFFCNLNGVCKINLFIEALSANMKKERGRNLRLNEVERNFNMETTQMKAAHGKVGASAGIFSLIQTYAENAADDALKMAQTRNLLIANAEDELLLGDEEAFKQKIQDAIYKHLLNANIK